MVGIQHLIWFSALAAAHGGSLSFTNFDHIYDKIDVTSEIGKSKLFLLWDVSVALAPGSSTVLVVDGPDGLEATLESDESEVGLARLMLNYSSTGCTSSSSSLSTSESTFSSTSSSATSTGNISIEYDENPVGQTQPTTSIEINRSDRMVSTGLGLSLPLMLLGSIAQGVPGVRSTARFWMLAIFLGFAGMSMAGDDSVAYRCQANPTRLKLLVSYHQYAQINECSFCTEAQQINSRRFLFRPACDVLAAADEVERAKDRCDFTLSKSGNCSFVPEISNCSAQTWCEYADTETASCAIDQDIARACLHPQFQSSIGAMDNSTEVGEAFLSTILSCAIAQINAR
mmetsp:Transcript_34851/g.63663  ORF Transcript_34851/g.63663 Transcript_34851/m.63663 type:complete len:343 (+) Transcript_34851:65-1093(+)